MTRAEKRALKRQTRNAIKEFLKIQEHCFPDLIEDIRNMLSVPLNQQGYEEQQIFFFAELTGTFHDQFVERVQIAGHFLI